jgi:hypothetical protein
MAKPLKNPGDPYGTRTRVYGVRGRCPRPLDEGVAKVAFSKPYHWTIASKNMRPARG